MVSGISTAFTGEAAPSEVYISISPLSSPSTAASVTLPFTKNPTHTEFNASAADIIIGIIFLSLNFFINTSSFIFFKYF